MLQIKHDFNCCGIVEISGLSPYAKDSKGALRDFMIHVNKEIEQKKIGGYDRSQGPKFRFAIFSQAGHKTLYGTSFADLIEEKGLGNIVHTRFARNPNSGNPVKVWIWELDFKAIKQYLKDN